MTRTANSLTLASLVALLSATPTVALSGSTDCTPSDPVAMRACFHSVEFNVVDDLDVYTRDLSAHGTSRPASGKSEEAPVAVKSINGVPARASAAPELDSSALRAFFHSAAFDATDGLTVYGRSYGSEPAPGVESGVREVAQLPH